MIAYGGFLDNGSVSDELLSFDLLMSEWKRVYPKKNIEGFAQAACTTVMAKRDPFSEKEIVVSLVVYIV